MTCVHLKQLYQLCADNQVTISAPDLVKFVCHQCHVQEECPSMLTDEYEARERERQTRPAAVKPAG